eukprot:4676504-Pyramimonas_sp.AAC.1
MPKQNAVTGPALASSKQFLAMLHRVSDALTFKYSDPKSAIGQVIREFPKVLDSFPACEHCCVAGDISDRTMTICNHARRLKDEKRLREAMGKCT